MFERGSWLRARGGGRDLLLSTRDLREVIEAPPLSRLPGRIRGIGGVVVHQGEFLPVLAWNDLPGCRFGVGTPMALAVLRPRLGVPLDGLSGTLDLEPDIWQDVPEADPWKAWIDAVGRVGEEDLPRLDIDRLVSVLRRLRTDR